MGTVGPKTAIGEYIHSWKYRGSGESYREYTNRAASALADSPEHFEAFRSTLRDMRFLPGGRIQSAIGSARQATAYNCFVMRTIHDSMDSIMDCLRDSVETMRRGGGVGYDFSNLRPRGDRIKTLDSLASGPVSFMGMFDAACKTISSAGHRRGAQMGVLRVDHPDIELFIHAKQNQTELTAFNISIAVTDEFMEAVKNDDDFTLRFDGEPRGTIKARPLWETIMRSAWDWAEPGVLFIDRINEENNLWYCEEIAATNPCGEQPLPPNGACLLGSFNLTKYLKTKEYSNEYTFDWAQFKTDIPHVVRAMDNVIDRTLYPLPAQEQEAKQKRRMGLGVTGVANAGEALGFPYGSSPFIRWMKVVLGTLRNEAYWASVGLAREKGAFPLFVSEDYTSGKFVRKLPWDLQQAIKKDGIRNSHLLSIAPTGTISLSADNISSGIEPVFSHSYQRTIQTEDGATTVNVEDYGCAFLGVDGKLSSEVSIEEHVNVLAAAQELVDSAVSKTCNVNPQMPWAEFKQVYMSAWMRGCKGITTFNPEGKRFGILQASPNTLAGAHTEAKSEEPQEAQACYIDPETGAKTCGD